MKPNSLIGAPSETAILVIDAQAPFLKPCAMLPELLGGLRFCVEAAALLKLPVLFTEQAPDKLGPTLPQLVETAAEAPTFTKTAMSAMRAQGLPEALKAAGAKRVLIAGVETPICILQSAVELAQAGFQPTVLTDCVGCRRERDGRDALAWMLHAGISALPAEACFYAIAADAAHPEFKPFTQLVKRRPQLSLEL